MFAHHGVQHPGRGGALGRLHQRAGLAQGGAVVGAAVGGVQRGRQGFARRQHFVTPLGQGYSLALALQQQAGLAATLGREVLVLLEFRDFFRGVRRTV